MSETAQNEAPVHRSCPVCGGDGGVPCLVKGSLRVVLCGGCGMRFANPVAARFAGGTFYGEIAESFYLSPAKLESDFSPVRFERELWIFRKYCQKGVVLDVGCSTGGFLHQLQSRFVGAYSVLGTDVAGPALNHAESVGVPVLRGSYLEHDFGGSRFHAITFWAVLEHVMEPACFLAKAVSLLEPGGHCFVLVPNGSSLAARCLGARYRYVMEEHLNYFTTETLRRLVAQQSSLLEVELVASHFNPAVLWQDWRSGGEVVRVPDEARARLLQRTTRWKRARWVAPLKIVYRAVEKGLAGLGMADNLMLVLRRV
jgi:2-polyprenyl-3-methyl-5-hydroxy-6-metoxy-1,4-benzoquinol methylase